MNENQSDVSPESAAVAALDAKRTDPAFAKAYAGGDAASRQEMRQLLETAYKGDDESSGESASHELGAQGAPQSPAQYRFNYFPGRDVDAGEDRDFRALAHAAGLPQSLAAHLFNNWTKAKEGPSASDAEIQLTARATEFKLRERWGADYDKKITAAKSVFKSLPAEHARLVDRLLNKSNLGSDQHLIERLAIFAEHRTVFQPPK